MNGNAWTRLAAAVVLGCAVPAGADVVDEALAGRIGGGSCGEAAAAIEGHLREHPGDDRALFALGLTRALHGFELVSQWAYRYGATNTMAQLGGMGFPPAMVLPRNPEPDPVRLENLRAIVIDAMAQAQAGDEALARVDGDFDVRVDILALRMDLDGDGKADEHEKLLSLLDGAQIRLRGEGNDVMRELPVDFDRGDAEWLRGYCHLAMALGEVILAHDGTELFERAGHVLFPRNVTPYEFLKGPRSPFEEERQYVGFDPIDGIALIHLMHFPVAEPERMERARRHLLEATVHARAMWALYDAETDDRAEWVPNPKQTAAFPRAVVDDDMRAVWLHVIDQGERLLEGEVLLPFWRGDGTRGVNVKRVFTEPTTLDPVLWFQGSAAGPYLEGGEVLDTGIWRDMELVFNRRTFRHMFWLN